jgi:hypothetical protein
MSTNIPGLCNLLAQWWGTGPECYGFAATFTNAANLAFGTNPPYQISDFLAIYPKFGVGAQAITQAAISPAPGTGYALNDVLVPVQIDANGATLTVTAVGVGGLITALVVSNGGTGYSVANGIPVTGGAGSGALVNITAISPYSGVIPQAVLQLYINLANACLMQARWFEMWPMAMALFVAHFCTLWLRSEGNPGTTAQQVAASGLEKGIIVSSAAGDVSLSRQVLSDLAGFAAWGETTYGTQLATFAKIVGIGPMYIY